MAFEPYLAYEASAGSGKTFNLVVRYLSLLFMDVDPEKIMALTFTNKAANEMQERIAITLKNLASRGELSVISEVTGQSEAMLLSKRDHVLERFLNAENKILTIDKLFSKILRKFSLHAGLMPTFTSFESQHEINLMIRFLNEVNAQGKDAELIDLSLVSSKRLSDIFKLLEGLYAKLPELSKFTFQEQKTSNIEAEIMQNVAQLKGLFDLETLSSRSQKTLHVSSVEELLTKTWVIKESMQYWDFKKQYIPEMDSYLKQIKIDLKVYMQEKENRFFRSLFTLLEIYKKSRRDLAQNDGELSFDDITSFVYYLLKERVDSEFLYFRLDSKIEHLLLDEFQDTSVIQFDILRPIIEEILSGKGVNDSGSFFFVGDVKQSIYRFRGGVSALFGEVAEHPAITLKPLVTNYRSQRVVVEFVNQMFAKKISGYIPQQVKEGAKEGYVEVINDEAILERCVIQVKALIDAGVQSDDIAILCATNADGASIEELLKADAIDVVTETTAKLIRQRSVMAIIEYLKYCYFNERIYAENFFALIGKESEKLESVNLKNFDMLLHVKKIIDRYELFSGDMNLLRFVELLHHYSDIEQFIFEYERIDKSAAKADLHGVRVLTVHKSKGLEFEHVIVLDRLGKKQPNTDPIIYEYKGTHLENIYLRQKNRVNFDDDYKRAMQREEQAGREDELNALYVAFTRAESSLFIIQKEKNSKFSLLDLREQSQGSLKIERKTSVVKVEPKPLKYEALHYGRQKEVIESEEEIETDHHAITFGLALHYTLEMMRSFERSALALAMTATQNRYGALLDESALTSIEQRILQVVANSEFRELTDGEIYKEQALSFEGELRYLDLLVKHKERWVIIDYKSSLSHSEAHLKQVGFYKKALREITGEAVEGYLCYLLDEGVKMVAV
ncbi:MAG: RecB-like helicase [Campylobacterota bacterium]|nr:RecB-like helicase [Campylobacterota bacterium]